MRIELGVAVAAMSLASCVGTTGSDLVTFDAFAAGPADIATGEDFVSGRGFHVVLTRARLHVGAVYLNRSVPSSGAQATSCVATGIYVAQVTKGLDVDLLSPELQAFPTRGEGTADHASAGEVWLMGTDDVNASDDPTIVVDVAGRADGLPFKATFTIGKNRLVPPPDPSSPGTNPLCKQRIVTPIPVDLTPKGSGSLVLRVDPRAWFANVDFAALAPAPSGSTRQFVDGPADPASNNLYLALHATTGVYAFEWRADGP